MISPTPTRSRIDSIEMEVERLTEENRALAANLARAENLIDTLAVALRQWADAHKTMEGPKP